MTPEAVTLLGWTVILFGTPSLLINIANIIKNQRVLSSVVLLIMILPAYIFSLSTLFGG